MCPLLPAPAQIVPGGNATLATTIAGLGPGSDGKDARLIVGASPYDFLDLVYSATYGKWVSPEFTWSLATSSANAATPSPLLQQVNAGTCTGWGPLIPWQLYSTAGLTLQLRYIVLMTNQSAATGTATPKNQGIASGGAPGSGTAIGSAITTTSASTLLLGDVAETSWRTANAAVNTFCLPTLELTTSTAPANTNTFLYQWTMMWRYVA